MTTSPHPLSRPAPPLARAKSTFGVRIDTPKQAADAVAAFGRQVLPQAWRFALIREPVKVDRKPVVYATLSDLARAIHRERQGRPIELVDAPLLLRFETEQRDGVSVFVLGESIRERLIGWAYVGGAGRRALQDALAATDPNLAGWGAQ